MQCPSKAGSDPKNIFLFFKRHVNPTFSHTFCVLFNITNKNPFFLPPYSPSTLFCQLWIPCGINKEQPGLLLLFLSMWKCLTAQIPSGHYGVKHATVSTFTTPDDDTWNRKSPNWISRCCWYNTQIKLLVQSSSYCNMAFFITNTVYSVPLHLWKTRE